jgi:hypothetical protein
MAGSAGPISCPAWLLAGSDRTPILDPRSSEHSTGVRGVDGTAWQDVLLIEQAAGVLSIITVSLRRWTRQGRR